MTNEQTLDDIIEDYQHKNIYREQQLKQKNIKIEYLYAKTKEVAKTHIRSKQMTDIHETFDFHLMDYNQESVIVVSEFKSLFFDKLNRIQLETAIATKAKTNAAISVIIINDQKLNAFLHQHEHIITPELNKTLDIEPLYISKIWR